MTSQRFRLCISARALASALAASAATIAAAPASASVFAMSWTGQFAGFTIAGSFAFDAAPTDGVVRAGD